MPGCLVVAKVTNGLKVLFGFVCRVRDGYSLDLPEKMSNRNIFQRFLTFGELRLATRWC